MKKNHYATPKRTVLISMILVPLIPFVLVLAVGYYYFTTSIETSTIATMNRIVQDHRQMIESFLQERKGELELIGDSYTFEELKNQERLRKVFEYLQKVSDAFVDLGIFNEAGLHVAYYGPYKLTGINYSEAEWFKEVMKKGYYISDIFLGYRRVPHFIIAIVRGEKGEKWAIRATIDTYVFNDLVEKVRIGKTGEAYILNASGILQTSRRSGGNLMDKDDDSSIEYPSSKTATKTYMGQGKRGDKYLYATTWLKNMDWLLVVRQEKGDAFRALHSAAYLIVLITIIGGGTIIGVAFYLSGRIARRMEEADADKERLTTQLIRASRLAELGEMAAGFAHEINNPLQIINNEKSLIALNLAELKENGQLGESEWVSELEDSIEQIGIQIRRCAEITQAILKFGRKEEPLTRDVDIRRFIPEVTSMVASKASVNGIAVREEISGDTPLVHCDPSQLQQVLLNLYNNAIDAIIERHGVGGGALAIEAGKGEDGKVEISVKDNGCGISPENLDKVFSPFFTTKPAGKGTGLGLSVCYGIIINMGGQMDVSSEKDVGTTFLIHLPAAT
ncbi:MAG: ATP-binding protein [Pseudomonadota bacterium]